MTYRGYCKIPLDRGEAASYTAPFPRKSNAPRLGRRARPANAARAPSYLPCRSIIDMPHLHAAFVVLAFLFFGAGFSGLLARVSLPPKTLLISAGRRNKALVVTPEIPRARNSTRSRLENSGVVGVCPREIDVTLPLVIPVGVEIVKETKMRD